MMEGGVECEEENEKKELYLNWETKWEKWQKQS